MTYVHVPMTGLKAPTEAETKTILAILEKDSTGAVFVHCKRGADRTGAVIAAYRIEHEGWNSAAALKEAVSKGMHGTQHPRQQYILNLEPRTLAPTGAGRTGPAPVS
jgi:protein-tyrosine phosphatase